MASESGQKITSRMGLDLCTPILRRPLYSPYDLHRIPTGRHPNFPPVDPSSIHVGFWSLASILTTSLHSHSTIPPFIYLVGLSFPLRTSASRCSNWTTSHYITTVQLLKSTTSSIPFQFILAPSLTHGCIRSGSIFLLSNFYLSSPLYSSSYPL